MITLSEAIRFIGATNVDLCIKSRELIKPALNSKSSNASVLPQPRPQMIYLVITSHSKSKTSLRQKTPQAQTHPKCVCVQAQDAESAHMVGAASGISGGKLARRGECPPVQQECQIVNQVGTCKAKQVFVKKR